MPRVQQHEYHNFEAMDPFAKVDLLVNEGHLDPKAAQMIVNMFMGRTSPEMRDVIEKIRDEITRTDLATKADLKAALEPYATKADLVELKVEMIDRISTVSGNLRNWIIGVGAIATALMNLDKIATLFGAG